MSMASLAVARLRTVALRSRTHNHLRSFSSSLARFQNEETPEAPPKPPKPIDDSTSALDYKNSHRLRPPPFPSQDLPRSRSAEEAVTNILYNTPPPSLQPFKKWVTSQEPWGFCSLVFPATTSTAWCKMNLVCCREFPVSSPEGVSTSNPSSCAGRKLEISVG